MNDVNVERVRSFLLRARAADGEELPAEHYCGLRTAGFPARGLTCLSAANDWMTSNQ